MKRHSDAIDIQRGACNPIAISMVLVQAIDEVRDKGTDAICADEGVRLILHQLCFLCNIDQLNDNHYEYQRCLTVCETALLSGGRL